MDNGNIQWSNVQSLLYASAVHWSEVFVLACLPNVCCRISYIFNEFGLTFQRNKNVPKMSPYIYHVYSAYINNCLSKQQDCSMQRVSSVFITPTISGICMFANECVYTTNVYISSCVYWWFRSVTQIFIEHEPGKLIQLSSDPHNIKCPCPQLQHIGFTCGSSYELCS